MSAQPVFLTASWRHLVMMNFAVEPARLRPLVPAGTEIATSEGTAYLSLVGFLFLDTRVKGVPIPFHRDFEEINLRFYVRRRGPEGWRQGVVFVREVVRKRAIAAAARLIYNERYVTRPTRSTVVEPTSSRGGSAAYGWKGDGAWLTLGASYGGPGNPPAWDEHIAHITINAWGYARQRDGGTVEYRVEHPVWSVWRGFDARLTGDVAGFYGPPLGEVLTGTPRSVLVADGSPVIVREGVRIESRTAA